MVGERDGGQGDDEPAGGTLPFPCAPQLGPVSWAHKHPAPVNSLQAFRHSYGLALEWRFFEPLILMVDEVYRGRAEGTLMAMRAAQRDKVKVRCRSRFRGCSASCVVGVGRRAVGAPA